MKPNPGLFVVVIVVAGIVLLIRNSKNNISITTESYSYPGTTSVYSPRSQ